MERSLTQVQLAELAGVAPLHISQLGGGRYMPSFATLRRITRAMGLQITIGFRSLDKPGGDMGVDEEPVEIPL